jgi:hypothetical protein
MQKTISLSTAEAEYYAASEMAIELIYLRNILEDIGFPQPPDNPVYACIEWGNHITGCRERAEEHIDLRSIPHMTQSKINRMMRLIKVDTTKQLADVFIKASAYPQSISCVRGICGKPAFPDLRDV